MHMFRRQEYCVPNIMKISSSCFQIIEENQMDHHHHHHHQILLWHPSTGAQDCLTTQIMIKRSIKYIKNEKVSDIFKRHGTL